MRKPHIFLTKIKVIATSGLQFTALTFYYMPEEVYSIAGRMSTVRYVFTFDAALHEST